MSGVAQEMGPRGVRFGGTRLRLPMYRVFGDGNARSRGLRGASSTIPPKNPTVNSCQSEVFARIPRIPESWTGPPLLRE